MALLFLVMFAKYHSLHVKYLCTILFFLNTNHITSSITYIIKGRARNIFEFGNGEGATKELY